jgi:hypothetical protein
MSSRTPEELILELDEGLAWRKKEMSALRFAVQNSADSDQPFMIRAAIALIYAHWEGYIKDVATRYLKYVGKRRLRYSELADPFAALGIRKEVGQLVSSVEPVDYIEAYRGFLERQRIESSLPDDNVIDTGSNLNYRRFRRILTMVGIDCTRYETREAMIDEKLLKSRNNIAHGELVQPDFDDYDELHFAVTNMLAAVKDQVSDAVIKKAYRK